MKKILAILLLFSTSTWAGNAHEKAGHSHEGHVHEELIEGDAFEVDPARFHEFIENLTDARIAVVSVKGMVCDFCARGIEKMFRKDKSVKKIDIDLSRGKVLIAYTQDGKIDFDDIKQKILANGQNATGLQILEI